MAQINDEIKKKYHFTRKDMFKEEQTYGLVDHWNNKANTRIDNAIDDTRLAERAKCIAQLKDHQAHCDNCAKDNIEMAIIILEKNEAIE